MKTDNSNIISESPYINTAQETKWVQRLHNMKANRAEGIDVNTDAENSLIDEMIKNTAEFIWDLRSQYNTQKEQLQPLLDSHAEMLKMISLLFDAYNAGITLNPQNYKEIADLVLENRKQKK